MNLLTRYLIREHVASFFGSLLLIVFIFTLNFAFQVLGKILGKGLSGRVILEYFLLNMAWILALAVPMAVLIATLMAFGRLAGDNEITALKSGGVNLVTLIRPIFLLAILLAVLLIGFNNSILPAFNHRAKMLRKSIYQKQPTMKMEESVFQFDIPGYVFLAKTIDHTTGEMFKLTIFDESEKNRRATILAEEGRLHFDEERAEFSLRLTEGEIHRLDLRQREDYATIAYDSARFRIEAP
ncbi:MAG: LptF/LptG family permease, partial [Candidatus Delongbacteria bacterium]|nr:LptF/LptG family permease [Candidatus Delongbacteria bacterium]